MSFSLNPYNQRYNSMDATSNTDTSKNKSTNSFSILDFSIISTHRHYINPKLFFETDVIESLQLGYNSTALDNKYPLMTATASVSSNRNLGNMLKIPLKVGFGRIENIEDARLALYILEEMGKNQQLSRQITDDDILAFSEKITQLKNKRYFDSRKRRIYEIQAVDSFLRSHNYTQAQDAVYFTSLLDNWEYANNPSRTAGKRYSIGISPYFDYNVGKDISKDDWYTFEKGFDLSGNYISSKVLNLYWQRDIEIETGYTRYWYHYNYQDDTNLNADAIKTNEISNNLYLAGNIRWGFYPNTRSYHSVSLNSRIQRTNISIPDNLRWAYLLSVSLNGYYYLSERLSFNYNFNAGYNESDSEIVLIHPKYNNFATSLYLSFKYSIF